MSMDNNFMSMDNNRAKKYHSAYLFYQMMRYFQIKSLFLSEIYQSFKR